jgi:ribosomal protein L22
MSPDETPEEKPKRRRRRAKADVPEVAAAPEAASSAGATTEAASELSTDAEVAAQAESGQEPEGDAEPAAKPKPRRRAARKPAAAKVAAEEVAAETPEAAEVPAAEASAVADETEVAEETEATEQPTPAAKPPAAPAPSRRRRGREPGAPIPVVRAQAKYVRCSPRKARLVCDHIRGKSVEEARAILALAPRAVARDWSKLLESAIANAEHNHELVGEDLYVKAVHADDGPTIKRFRPRAMGRATKIRKRTSHLTVLLTPKE